MNATDTYLPGIGPNLVEASAGTGKTTWMVTTAVRLLLQDEGMPAVARIDRILAVTFTRAATAELKERIRTCLLRVRAIREGGAALTGEQWIPAMLARGGARMSHRLNLALGNIDRLAVTTIHGFCKGVLQEFALECGVPAGLQFIEKDRDYRDEAVRDEWRALTWNAGRISAMVMSERTSGVSGRRNRWSPDLLERSARIVRQGIGAVRPERVDRDRVLDAVYRMLPDLLTRWNETRLREFCAQIKWNKGGLNSGHVDALCAAMAAIRSGAIVDISALTCWARSYIESVAHKANKVNRALIPAERFLDDCEGVKVAYESAIDVVWQDAVLAVAERMESAMQRDNVAGFDEMIGFLQRAIVSEMTGPRLRQALADRYNAVLVDEFQDTDWAQWTIFFETFSLRPLILVGDPKQSIYGFRGADISAYRMAKTTAKSAGPDRVSTLGTNYRSDRGLVEATEVLFTQTDRPFDVDKGDLDFELVQAARAEPTFIDPSHCPMVLVDLEDAGVPAQEAKIVGFIAAEVARLLRDPAVRYCEPSHDPRPLRPSDIAVLVSANRQAVPIVDALKSKRIAAVSGASGDIVDSVTWRDIMLIIAAIEDPSDPRVVRRALSTSLAGWSAAELAALGQDGERWHDIVDRLAEARRDWMSFGVLAALMRLINEWKGRAGMASHADGERRLTDFRHVISILQEAEVGGQRSPSQLLVWARAYAAESDRDAEYRQQQLESDEDAVTVSTVHIAKGLEWPVVICAYLWKAPIDRQTSPRVARFRDGSRRIVFQDGLADSEIPGDSVLSEYLRLAYVALTRARSRTYVVWAKTRGDPGAIHHLIGSLGAGAESPATVLAKRHPTLIDRLSEADIASLPEFPESNTDGQKPLEARVTHTGPAQTRSWTVSSYSRFTQGLKSAARSAEAHLLDEAETIADDSLRADQLPGGVHTGNALHELLERFDFAQVGDETGTNEAIGAVLRRYDLPRANADGAEREAARELVMRMMRGTLTTSIPGAVHPLNTVPLGHTLREWRFNLSMEGVSPARLADVFKAHAPGWVADTYAPLLARVSSRDIDGFLTGIVDLVAKIGDQWWVIDWKSNILGPNAEAYESNACRRAMIDEHYVLQYHLYVVALHRFLRMRMKTGYDYERDMGGVGYAFLRGLSMGAPAWFTDRPPFALVEALDGAIGGYSR